MLATGGGVVHGKTTGEFIALNADNGKQLWQFQTGSGINAMPVTFTRIKAANVTVLSARRPLLNQQRAAHDCAAGRIGVDVCVNAGVTSHCASIS